MDRFFSRHNFTVIGNGEFRRVFEQLRQNGVIEWGDKMLVKKGPNWKEPKFVTEKNTVSNSRGYGLIRASLTPANEILLGVSLAGGGAITRALCRVAKVAALAFLSPELTCGYCS